MVSGRSFSDLARAMISRPVLMMSAIRSLRTPMMSRPLPTVVPSRYLGPASMPQPNIVISRYLVDFSLPPQHASFRDSVRELAQGVALVFAAEVDRDHRFPDESVRAAAESGLLGVLIPREFGGAGLDALAFALCIDELAQACASTSVIVDVHTSVGSEPILLFGTQDQKRKWLPRLASGELLGAFALTEPAAGSLKPLATNPLHSSRAARASKATNSASPTWRLVSRRRAFLPTALHGCAAAVALLLARRRWRSCTPPTPRCRLHWTRCKSPGRRVWCRAVHSNATFAMPRRCRSTRARTRSKESL